MLDQVRIIVDNGGVEFCVLNLDNSEFTMQAPCGGAGPWLQTVFAHIHDIGQTGQVVIRN
jgi:hypothetical protein